MQNHLEISSKYNFWTRNVRNWSKSLTESLRKVYGISKTCPGGPIWAHMGPQGPTWAHMSPYRAHIWALYGLIWAHVGPCGPIWAHMGPPGQVLEIP